MHLFAGGGGGLLADLILGHNPIAAVEWEPAACQVLRKRRDDGWFPNLSVYEGDVRLFDPSDYEGRVDCIHAGFPCQDISVAGKQAGLEEGTRSGLYREVLRIAGIVRPRYLFLENVAAILNTGLGTVLADLATLGYDTRWCCIRASDVGAPHGRDRWWLRATMVNPSSQGLAPIHGWGTVPNVNRNSQGEECKRDEQQSGVGGSGDTYIEKGKISNANGINGINREGRPGQERSWENPQGLRVVAVGECGIGAELADTMRIGLQGQGQYVGCIGSAKNCHRETNRAGCNCEIGEKSRNAQPAMGSLANGLAAESFRDWYSEEPNIGRTAPKRIRHTANLKMLGNGQVPLQCALAWQILENPS